MLDSGAFTHIKAVPFGQSHAAEFDRPQIVVQDPPIGDAEHP
jgi:hypothetical protein